MKTNAQLLDAARTQIVASKAELDNGGGVTLTSLWKLEQQLRVATAAITELKNRAAGNQPPKEGN